MQVSVPQTKMVFLEGNFKICCLSKKNSAPEFDPDVWNNHNLECNNKFRLHAENRNLEYVVLNFVNIL
jgi:hypothetical protein